MVGIAGYTKINSESNPSDRESPITRMAKSITMTNRQETKLFLNKFLDFSMVTPPSPGFHGSAVNEEGSLGCAIYGKVFGFDGRVVSLEKVGHRFRDKSSGAEFILHLYEERGETAFEELNGSFLVVLFGIHQPRLMLVTDRFGTRPLYYSEKDRELIFSSHLRGILSYPVPKRVDVQAFIESMRYGRIGLLGDKTWIEGIKLMPPASVMRFSAQGCEIRRYWDLEYSPSRESNEPEIVKSLVRTFREGVRKRVRSDVGRCCVSLSGGLDARAIIGSLEPVDLHKVFAATFGEMRGTYDCDEVRIAEKVCRKLGVRHVVVDEYFFNHLERYVEFVIHIGAGEAPVSLVILPYFYDKIRRAKADCFLQGYMLDLLLGGSFLSRQLFTIKTFSEFLAFLDQRSTVFTDDDLERLLKKKLHPNISLARQHFAEIARRSSGDCFANKADYFFIATRVRRWTIMGSLCDREFLEELLPTIDNDFIEVVRKIPFELRYRHRIFRKFLMALNVELAKICYANSLVPPIFPLFVWRFGAAVRESLRLLHILSGGVVKVSLGRSYDLSQALRSDPNWRRMIGKTILNASRGLYNYVNREEVERLVHEHIAGIRDNSEKLIQLMTAELFLESLESLDNPRERGSP
jgi:asparagine synthase (glutamine-hydrolysing)